jgi:predicted lysophospholipase L1 biosynthesis ABC-type transport system permease subunit
VAPASSPEKAGWHFSFDPMLTEGTKDIRQWLLLAFGAVICVLLIACTNVSGLLLVRAAVRSREWAVRWALGASAGRLVRQILAETALLVVIGCGVGLGLAIALVRLINTYGPVHRTEIEPWALPFAFGLCILCTLVAGLLPAIPVVPRAARTSVESQRRPHNDGAIALARRPGGRANQHSRRTAVHRHRSWPQLREIA